MKHGLKQFLCFSIFFFSISTSQASFLDEQLRYLRVKKAYEEKKDAIESQLKQQGISIKDYHFMIKAYKYEQQVKLYVKKNTEKKWLLLKQYPFCWTSGKLGPKRREGDYQIPEGYYHINHFNPHSSFLLSLGVSYPNKADRIKSAYPKKGGAIYVHGGCATIGCIPIEDEPIKEVYILGVLARDNGQSSIPIHIFPFEYSEKSMETALLKFPENKSFWSNLFEVEKKFDETKIQGDVRVDQSGNYYLN